MAHVSPPPPAQGVHTGCFACVGSTCFSRRNRQASVQHQNGNSASEGSASHLVVMVNGIIGSASNWKFAADLFKSRFGSEVLVHCSARNAAISTFDGVDVMGHRLAEEVREVIDESPGLKRISFIAHSLGGLVARYAIGQLYTPGEPSSPKTEAEQAECVSKSPDGTILGLEPINFVTVATPHLGSCGSGQLPFLCGFTFLEKLALYGAHWIVGRTGKHLFLTDGNESQAPLLQRMVTDCPEGKFISALRAFQRRVAYANANYDHMVGWRTATFRREYELPKINKGPLDTKYPHVIRVEDIPAEVDDPNGNKRPALDPVEEVMIAGLRQVPWQRVDVSFSGSAQRLVAHSTIQVKYFWMHSDGADVIAHILDNLVL